MYFKYLCSFIFKNNTKPNAKIINTVAFIMMSSSMLLASNPPTAEEAKARSKKIRKIRKYLMHETELAFLGNRVIAWEPSCPFLHQHSSEPPRIFAHDLMLICQ